MNAKEFFQKEIVLVFHCLFACWIVLALLELFMPGFVIYYFNLNWLLAIIFVLGFVDLLVTHEK